MIQSCQASAILEDQKASRDGWRKGKAASGMVRMGLASIDGPTWRWLWQQQEVAYSWLSLVALLPGPKGVRVFKAGIKSQGFSQWKLCFWCYYVEPMGFGILILEIVGSYPVKGGVLKLFWVLHFQAPLVAPALVAGVRQNQFQREERSLDREDWRWISTWAADVLVVYFEAAAVGTQAAAVGAAVGSL